MKRWRTQTHKSGNIQVFLLANDAADESSSGLKWVPWIIQIVAGATMLVDLIYSEAGQSVLVHLHCRHFSVQLNITCFFLELIVYMSLGRVHMR